MANPHSNVREIGHRFKAKVENINSRIAVTRNGAACGA